jgi:hypothetical protein
MVNNTHEAFSAISISGGTADAYLTFSKGSIGNQRLHSIKIFSIAANATSLAPCLVQVFNSASLNATPGSAGTISPQIYISAQPEMGLIIDERISSGTVALRFTGALAGTLALQVNAYYNKAG